MKKIILILLTAIISLPVIAQEKANLEKEKAAIMAVMEEETAAYYANDINRWAQTYLQSPESFSISASKSGYGFQKDWKNIYENSKSFFTGEKGENNEIKTPELIKIYGNNAWVVFNNKTPGDEAYVTCFLEKTNGSWKIIYRNTVWTQGYKEADNFLINSINYAKSLGKSVEDIARFTADQFKVRWNLTGIFNGVLNYWRTLTPTEDFKILEQDENHIKLSASNLFPQLKNSGPIFNVSYNDYLLFIKIVFEQIADYVGAVYTQETTPNGVIVTIAKK